MFGSFSLAALQRYLTNDPTTMRALIDYLVESAPDHELFRGARS